MTSDTPRFGDLPAVLRGKTARLAARALGQVPVEQVPPALRRAAAFAPARRAKLAGEQIAAGLDSDPRFRAALAVQVRALVPALADVVEGDPERAGADPLEAAAAAFLLRSTGWQDVVRVGCAAASRADASKDPSPTDQRLADALASARADAQNVRDRLRIQLDKAKSENAELRQKLGATRQQLRAAEQRATTATSAADDAHRSAEASTKSARAEARRLRNRVSELETQLAGLLRGARDARAAETTRVRLLLDTVTEAAAGLRRELALPTVSLLPADTVTAVAPRLPDMAGRVGPGLGRDDPELLRRLLDLPRVHLVVDGYNVAKSAWPSVPLDEQRTRLIGTVAALVAGKSVETTLVFDAANATDVPSVAVPKGIRVRFSPAGVIADDLIRELVATEPHGRPVVVVSSDRELAQSVVDRGARSVWSEAMIGAFRR
jgi:predicted RNA-binding protein with PIN domain